MILVVKHIGIEGPGIIADFFGNTSWQTETIELYKGSRLPEVISRIEALIILGGPMNVHEEDKFPFLRTEDAFIKQAIKKEVPILGICLGAQLIAKACGGKVKQAEHSEIGWHKVGLTEQGRQDALFRNINNELDAFQWHNDTFQLPGKATLLATSGLCKNQAFRLGKNAYGLQFHFEVTPEMVESWIKKYLHSNDPDKIIYSKDLLIDTYKKERMFIRQANTILYNFSQIIANN